MPQDIPEDMPDRMPDRMPEDMSEDMPEDMPDRMPDRMPEDMSDRMPEDMPDRMPEDLPDRMPEDMPDRMPNRLSEDMSDRMPEDVPVRTCINVMVGITRSKVILFRLSKIGNDKWGNFIVACYVATRFYWGQCHDSMGIPLCFSVVFSTKVRMVVVSSSCYLSYPHQKSHQLPVA